METEITIEKATLVKELQNLLSSWMNAKPDTRSIASLSRATGAADSTIRRLVNGGIKIQEDSIFKLLSHIFDVQTYEGLSEALEQTPETLKWFQRHYSYLKKMPSVEQYKYSSVADHITKDPITFSVYMQISSTPGVEQGYVREQFGIRGDIELDKLLQKELVYLKDGKLYPKETKLRLTREQTINLMPTMTEMFHKQDHAFNARTFVIEGVSKATYIKLMDVYEAFIEEVSATILAGPGDVPVIVAGFMDTFTSQPFFEGDKK